MAGSYEHLTHGWSMIENMGDAYEAVEQLLWLVESQIGTERATRLLNDGFYPMKRGERPQDAAFVEVARRMKS
jgi:hypothetical protein